MNLIIIKGVARDYPLQTYLMGGGGPAVYASGDILIAGLYPACATSAMFTPTVAWYTALGTQTGYGQGQIVVTISASQAAQLEVSGCYTLLVRITPASDPTKIYAAARLRVAVEPISYPC